MNRWVRCAAVLLALGGGLPLHAAAEVSASDAWMRSTVPGQKTTGVYLTLRTSAATSLVGVASPIAVRGEVHEMRQDGGVMRMRSLPGLDLPAGRTVELKPGAVHLMLLDVQRPLRAGEAVPVVLTFRDAAGATSTMEVLAQVRGPAAHGGAVARAHSH